MRIARYQTRHSRGVLRFVLAVLRADRVDRDAVLKLFDECVPLARPRRTAHD